MKKTLLMILRYGILMAMVMVNSGCAIARYIMNTQRINSQDRKNQLYSEAYQYRQQYENNQKELRLIDHDAALPSTKIMYHNENVVLEDNIHKLEDKIDKLQIKLAEAERMRGNGLSIFGKTLSEEGFKKVLSERVFLNNLEKECEKKQRELSARSSNPEELARYEEIIRCEALVDLIVEALDTFEIPLKEKDLKRSVLNNQGCQDLSRLYDCYENVRNLSAYAEGGSEFANLYKAAKDLLEPSKQTEVVLIQGELLQAVADLSAAGEKICHKLKLLLSTQKVERSDNNGMLDINPIPATMVLESAAGEESSLWALRYRLTIQNIMMSMAWCLGKDWSADSYLHKQASKIQEAKLANRKIIEGYHEKIQANVRPLALTTRFLRQPSGVAYGGRFKYFNGSVYVYGISGVKNEYEFTKIIAKYNILSKNKGVSPMWIAKLSELDRSWGIDCISVAHDGLYLATLVDTGGHKYDKWLLAKYPFGTKFNCSVNKEWSRYILEYRKTLAYSNINSSLMGLMVVNENNIDYVYVVGGKQGSFCISKVAGDGTVVWERMNPEGSGYGIAIMDGAVYTGGVSSCHPYLQKYDTNGSLIWARTSDPLGYYESLIVMGKTIYAVGKNGLAKSDLLIEKWDENGNKIWSRIYDCNYNYNHSGGAINVNGHLFILSSMESVIIGGKIFLIEIDPEIGEILSVTSCGEGIATLDAGDEHLYIMLTRNDGKTIILEYPLQASLGKNDEKNSPIQKYKRNESMLVKSDQNNIFTESTNLGSILSTVTKGLISSTESDVFYDTNLNMEETANEYIFKMNIVGLDKNKVRVKINGSSITVTGNYSSKTEQKNPWSIYSSQTTSSFTKTVSLPENANLKNIKSETKGDTYIIHIGKKVIGSFRQI
ncbi:MAG: Hsp20 family protein [Candidatus Omnitrophica bacterium]|nr:Hsp20 family protein [Candidatus Omnitrophota bacterium]MDD5690488.1 Hsp20 family protein [Candidatus Omnitrophota bacterium]